MLIHPSGNGLFIPDQEEHLSLLRAETQSAATKQD